MAQGNNARNFALEPKVGDKLTEAQLVYNYRDMKYRKQFYRQSMVMALVKKGIFKGTDMEHTLSLSQAASVSAGYLFCDSTAGKTTRITVKCRNLYGYTNVDGKTMTIFKNDPEHVIASFAERFLDPVVDVFNANIERMIMCNDRKGSGLLDEITAVSGTGTSVDPFVLDLATDSILYKYEEGMKVHLDDDGSEQADSKGLRALTIQDVIEADVNSGSPLQLVATGTPLTAPAAGVGIYTAGSKDDELPGLAGFLRLGNATAAELVADPTANQFEGVDFSNRRMRSTVIDVSTRANDSDKVVSSRLFRDALLKVKRKSGQVPNMVVTSPEIFRDLEEIYEGSVQLQIPYCSDKKCRGGKTTIGFDGVEIMVAGKVVKVVSSEWLKPGEAYLLNSEHMVLKWRKGGAPMWDSRDSDSGSILRTVECADYFSARYVAYGAFFANPHYHGLITGIRTNQLGEV